jgi:hypothetical protein
VRHSRGDRISLRLDAIWFTFGEDVVARTADAGGAAAFHRPLIELRVFREVFYRAHAHVEATGFARGEAFGGGRDMDASRCSLRCPLFHIVVVTPGTPGKIEALNSLLFSSYLQLSQC